MTRLPAVWASLRRFGTGGPRRTHRPVVRGLLFASVAVLVVVIAGAAGMRYPAPAESATFAVSPTPNTTRSTFRLGLFNIRRFKGSDGRADPERTARSIQGCDLVALNEVGGAGWFDDKTQSDLLGNLLHMHAFFFPTERRFGKDSFGNGLLTKVPLASWQSERLASPRAGAYRQLVEVKVLVGDRPVTLLVTHLENGVDRAVQLAAVLKRFAETPPPVILAGDLNTRISDPQLHATIDSDTVDAIAGPAERRDPLRRDWILTRGVKVVDSGAVDYGASDHRAYWADLELPDATTTTSGD